MRIKVGITVTFFVFICCTAPSVQAKTGAIQLDNGIDLTPTVSIDHRYIDNVLYAETQAFSDEETILTTAALAS